MISDNDKKLNIQFFQYKIIVYVGYGFIPLGIFMLVVGFRRYVKYPKFIYEISDKK